MPYFQMDDGFYSELAVEQAGVAAFGLYALCGDWVADKLTDGFVPREIATRWGTREWIERLVASGLWMPTDGGYLMPDYLGKHGNRTRARIEAERAAKAERDRKYWEKKNRGRGSTPAPIRRVERRDESPSNDATHDTVNDAAPSLPTPKGVGVGAGGAEPSTGPAAYGDRTPANAGSPVPGSAPPAPTQDQLPAHAEYMQVIRETLRAGKEKRNSRLPPTPPTIP